MPRIVQALPKTIAKAKEFTNIISALLNVIDELSMEIPEGKYIECMNLLKDLHGFRPNEDMTTIIHNIVDDNVIIRQQRNITRASELNRTKKLEKNMTICKYCDTTITKSHIAVHHTTNKCLQIRKTKKLSAYTGKVQTSDIKQQVDKIKNFDKRFSATKCLYWWKSNMMDKIFVKKKKKKKNNAM
jgi:hypothetical protein